MSLIGTPAVEWWRARAERPLPAATPRVADDGDPVAFRATLAFLAVLIVSPQQWIPLLGSVRIALLLAAVAIGSHLLSRLAAGRRLSAFTPEIGLAAMLVAWAIATVPLSRWPGGSVDLLLRLYVKAVIVFWLLPNVVTSPARLRRTVVVLCAAGTVPALVAVRNFVTHGAHGGRISGFDAPLTGNPNDLALFLNLLLPLVLALFVAARDTRTRALLVAVMAVDVVAVIFTFSRSGFIALIVVAVGSAATLLRRAGIAAAGATGIVLVLAIALAPAGYSDRVATIIDTERDPTGSAQERWRDLFTAARLVLENPVVGAGIGMSHLALNEARGSRWIDVHNVYLQYGVDLGLVGMALFVALLVRSIRAARTARRVASAAGAEEFARLAAGVQVSLVAFAVAAIFYPVAYDFFFYYLGGLGVASRLIAARVAAGGAAA